MHRVLKQGLHRGLFHLATGIHHHHPVRSFGNHAQIMGDQHDGCTHSAVEFHHQLENLRLDGHIQRRGRLIGNQQLGVARQGHRNHHPLAHAARELVRVVVHAALRIGDAHQAQHLSSTGHGCRPRQTLVNAHRLSNLRTHGMYRVERGHGLLEHHGDLVATNAAHLWLTQAGEVFAFKAHLALHDATGVGWDEPHHRQGSH